MSSEKVVIVGAGGIFKAWIPHIIEEQLDVAAIVDINEAAAVARRDTYGLDCAVSSDLDAVLSKIRPDFVLDLTVPAAHCAVTCKALRAGCDVIGEKPMADSMAAAREMVKAAEESGKLYMVSQSRRWEALHVACCDKVTGGNIGDLTTVNCDFYIGAHFGGFRAEMESPLVLDMAIHHFDLARMMSGSDPVAVYAHEFNPFGSWYRGDAAATCIFEMTGNVVFTYRGSWCAEGFQTSWNGNWQFTGTRGGLRYENDAAPEICLLGEAGDGLIWQRDVQPVMLPEVKPTQMGGALAEMLRYQRTGQMPQTDCRDNIKSLAMVFAAMESARKKQRIVL